ncbi:MAG: hypothetical protein WDA16_06370 [Candidatus Thermoplasmatota archaeon]
MQYLSAASGAEDLTRPLLIYYGTLALGRSLILLTGGASSEAALKQSHGLQNVAWESAIAQDEFLALQLKVVDGTFSDVAKLTGALHKAWVKDDEGGASLMSFPQEQIPDHFSLGNILERLPGLSASFPKLAGTPTRTHESLLRRRPPENLIVWVPNEEMPGPGEQRDWSKAFFGSRLGALDIGNPHVGQNDPDLAEGGFVRGELWAEYREAARRLGYAETHDDMAYLVEPLPGRVWLSPIAKLMAAAYAFGMLARYYPTAWTAIARGPSASPIGPLASLALREIENEFPRQWVRLVVDPWRGWSAT